MARRKENTVGMGGLFDFLDPSKEGSIFDAFGKKPPKGRKEEDAPILPALPAPKGSQLPVVREERGGGLIPEKGTLKERLLSIFEPFGPPSEEPSRAALIPEEIKETPQEMISESGTMWEAMFTPSPETRPVYEAVPVREDRPKYRFVSSQITKIPYGQSEWKFPTLVQMAENLKTKIDLNQVFTELGESRLTSGYQELLAEAAFRGFPLYMPITVIDDKNFYTDFAEFYGIPWSVMESSGSKEEIMANLIRPLGYLLTETFEVIKPDFLPGFFTVDYNGQDGKYWLFYVEPWLGRLPGL